MEKAWGRGGGLSDLLLARMEQCVHTRVRMTVDSGDVHTAEFCSSFLVDIIAYTVLALLEILQLIWLMNVLGVLFLFSFQMRSSTWL